MGFSRGSAVTTWSMYTPGVITDAGSMDPSGVSSSTSATVMRPEAAHSGLKFCAVPR